MAEQQQNEQSVNHPQQLPMLNNKDSSTKIEVPNNSVQGHIIARLSEQVKGLEDKQNDVKQGLI